MGEKTRKLVGTFGLLAMTIAYCIIVGAIYANFLGGQAWWVLIIYFAAAGLAWFFPAAWLIRWMDRIRR